MALTKLACTTHRPLWSRVPSAEPGSLTTLFVMADTEHTTPATKWPVHHRWARRRRTHPACPLCGTSVYGDDAVGVIEGSVAHAECALVHWLASPGTQSCSEHPPSDVTGAVQALLDGCVDPLPHLGPEP